MDYSWKYHIRDEAVFHEGNIAEDTRRDTLARRDKLVTPAARIRLGRAEQPDGEDSRWPNGSGSWLTADDAFEVDNLVIAIYDPQPSNRLARPQTRRCGRATGED